MQQKTIAGALVAGVLAATLGALAATEQEWYDSFAKKWGEANGVNVTVDHINLAELPSRTAAEVSCISSSGRSWILIMRRVRGGGRRPRGSAVR